ncbi:MAG TPA: transglutaminaseTgpA domain-containing protein [Acidimicrobiales bacterium]|nr:transglutaminaseTgpA domain-containing protein [Acidimicrobiales bacterium]
MAVLAALAVALAAWFSATAQGGAGVGALGVPPVVLAAALAVGVLATAARRPALRVLPAGKDAVVLTAVTVAGGGALFLAGWTNGQHVSAVARLLPLAVAVLGLLWPEPAVLRYCLVVCAGSLLGAAVGPTRADWALYGALVALAAGVVATNRLAAAGARRLGGPATTERRRVGAEAVAVLAVAGLLAAVAASLLPPPPGGGSPQRGNGRSSRPNPQPALGGSDRLDVGAAKGTPSNAVLFRVSAPGPDLWRVTTYDHWDGEAWTRSADPLDNGSPRFRPGAADRTFVRPGIGDVAAVSNRAAFVQRVTIQAAVASVLPAAARPEWVTVAGGGVSVGADESLRPDPVLGKGDTYVVESIRADADPATLRAADGLDDPSSAIEQRVADAYLQLPAVPSPVTALAQQLTAGAATTYDRARAVEAWLQDNTRVTRTAPAVPAGADPIETFLLTDRSGPAERSATAMVVMLRSVGVPARLAVGYLPGTRDGLTGDFVVRGRDGHAWVEVWFPGVGWHRFDPTGLAPPPGASDNALWSRLERLARQLWPLLVLVALALGGWLAWRALHRWRRRAAEPWATRFFARLERAGTARGRPKEPHETPVEYADGLARTVLPDPRLVEVGAVVTAAAWSRRDVSPEDRDRAERVLREASHAAPVRRFRRSTPPRPAQGPTIPEP